MSDEPGLLITTGNGTPFQEVLPASLENAALTATGNVRASVAPEIRANLREVEIIPTSPGSESLDQDSTIRHWTCERSCRILHHHHHNITLKLLHIIGHIGDGFYTSNDLTNSVKTLKEETDYRFVTLTIGAEVGDAARFHAGPSRSSPKLLLGVLLWKCDMTWPGPGRKINCSVRPFAVNYNKNVERFFLSLLSVFF